MSSQPAAPKKILIVDDDKVVLNALQFILKKAGYQTVTTEDPLQTLTMVRAEKPDLILLDLSFPMDTQNIGGPEVDGFFIINRLRMTPGLEKIPIVIVSSADPDKYKDRATACGALTCLQKPINRQEILDTVDTVFRIFHK